MELDEIRLQVKLLEKAYNAFKTGIEREDLDDLSRDGVIQRFEFVIELCWKTFKKIIRFEGGDDKLFPKECFRVFYEKGIIEDIEVWFKFLDSRNLLSHTYNEEMSDQIYTFIKNNYKQFDIMISNLNELINKTNIF